MVAEQSATESGGADGYLSCASPRTYRRRMYWPRDTCHFLREPSLFTVDEGEQALFSFPRALSCDLAQRPFAPLCIDGVRDRSIRASGRYTVLNASQKMFSASIDSPLKGGRRGRRTDHDNRWAFQYVADQAWARLPPGQEFGLVSQLAVDRAGRVIVVQRAEPAVLIFAPNGSLEQAWHHEKLTSVHGVCVAPDDNLFITSFDAHQVLKFTLDGTLRMELGHFGRPHWNMPFNHPTDVAVAQDGEIFVTDGYGNARVHRFARDGAHITSWGSWGRKPGQFACPHGICVDEKRNLVIAVDRDMTGYRHLTVRVYSAKTLTGSAVQWTFGGARTARSLSSIRRRAFMRWMNAEPFSGEPDVQHLLPRHCGRQQRKSGDIAVQGPSRVVRLERITDLGADEDRTSRRSVVPRGANAFAT